MLAYVFWHWPRADVAAAAYETVPRRFLERLAAVDPRKGFFAIADNLVS